MDGIGSELCWWDLRHRSWFDDWVCGILLLAGRGWAELGRGEEGGGWEQKWIGGRKSHFASSHKLKLGTLTRPTVAFTSCRCDRHVCCWKRI